MDENFFKKHEVLAFLPEYLKDIGEGTRIIASKGKDHLVPISLRTFKINICKYYSIDYESIRKRFGKIIGSVNCIPLPINTSKVFVQLKVRKPKLKGDTTMGYIELSSIRSLKRDGNEATDIILKNGKVVKVLYKPSTINKHIKNGRLILECYRKERGYRSYPETLEKLYTTLEKPATKGDIAILVKEIATIKNSLKVY